MTIVTTMPTAKKVFAALVVATPLTLVACGSGEAEGTDDTATDAAAAESSVASSDESTAAEDGADADSTEDAEAADAEESTVASSGSGSDSADEPVGSAQAAAGQGAVSQGEDLEAAVQQELEGQNVQGVEQDPVEGGAPASQADQEEISNLVNGIYTQTTLKGMVEYIPNNMCADVLAASNWDPSMNNQGIPDMPLDQIPQYQQAQPSVDAIENLNVAGNQASADVTVTSAGETDTSVMRFAHEDGQWKFCSSEI